MQYLKIQENDEIEIREESNRSQIKNLLPINTFDNPSELKNFCNPDI